MHKIHRPFLLLALLPGASLMLLSYLPFDIVILDILSHFKVQYAFFFLASLLLGIILQKKRIAIPSVLLLLPLLLEFLPYYLPSDSITPSKAPSFSVLTMNVLSENEHYEKAIEEIKYYYPDILVLIEVNQAWWDNLNPHLEAYTHRCFEIREDNFGIALLSKLPLDTAFMQQFSAYAKPSIEAQLTWQGKPFSMIATHPTPAGSRRKMRSRNTQLAGISHHIQQKTLPVILTGDLNTTSFSPTFKNLISSTSLVDSRLGEGLQATWPVNRWLPQSWSFPFMITLDHTLVSAQFEVVKREIGKTIGSDHLPVYTELSWKE